jgi:hypothetical protein
MSHSCTTKYVSDKELEIDSTFLCVFKSMSNNKLLVFKDNHNNIVTYKISEIDSVIRNKKGWFINSAPNKELTVAISEIYQGRTVLNGYYNQCVVSRVPFENKSYFIPKDGIIAYKMFSGEFWKRDFGISTTDRVP